jgi:hypothetical protein
VADEVEADAPSNRMRSRVPGSRLKLWLLLTASRWLVAAGLLAVVFVVLVILGAIDPVGLRTGMSQKDPIETAFQALLTAIITGVTLVVTINQLVLAQELGAVGDQRERMEGSMAFRADVADLLDQPVAPAEPADLLRALIDATRGRAETLASTAEGTVGDQRAEQVRSYVDSLAGNADSVADRLTGAKFGTFQVVDAALDYNYSWKIYEGQRLQSEIAYEGGAVHDAFDEVVECLTLFGTAREHVKTFYFQWELIDLSRAVIYAAVPSLLVVTAVVLYLDTPGTIPGATLGVDNLVWVVSGAVTVALLPFALLLAYILRIATVTKRTLAIGPFVLRETDRVDDIDWE